MANNKEWEEETLTSLKEKRVALENLVKSQGWELLVELFDKRLKLLAAQGMANPASGLDDIPSVLEQRGAYQELLKAEEFPQQMIDELKRLEEEKEEQENG